MEGIFRHHLWLRVLLLVEVAVQGGGCLRDVSLTVNPPAVLRGQDASFVCQYDLEGAALYSAKFYRGRFEFYRYSPSMVPAFKVFSYPGIIVDLSGSDEHQVMLRDVGFNLSGNLSCEVTVEAPKFTTITVYNRLLVVEIPKGPPEIHSEYGRYYPGDVLRANCSSPPSRPAATLSFLLNNYPVITPEVQHTKATDSLLYSSFLSLNMQLFPSHFDNDHLVLQCTASVDPLYHNTSEVTLGARPRDPVPERVTSSQTTSAPSALLAWLLIGGLILR